jgi:hypothetical protein
VKTGVSLNRVYEVYAYWALSQPQAAPYALFRWWMRQQFDGVWFGPPRGEWLVGVALR